MPLVLRNTKGTPLSWDELDGNFTYLNSLIGSTMTDHLAAVDPHSQYTTAAEASAAAPVQTVFGRSGAVVLNSSDVTTALGYTPQTVTQKGVANGYCDLDASGLVPAVRLPSYVDDILEYATVAEFPVTGESGKIYVALNTGRTYRWGGSAYTEIIASPGTTDNVTEGSTNLYFTNARARSAISVTQNLSYNSSTGVITGPDLSGYATKNGFQLTGNITSSGNPSINIGTGALNAGNGSFSGNLAVGSTLNPWDVGTVIQVGSGGGYIFGDTYQQITGTNSYYQSGWKRQAVTIKPTQYNQADGVHRWYVATAGSAGSAISWSQLMTLDDAGMTLAVPLNIGTGALSAGAITSSGDSIFTAAVYQPMTLRRPSTGVMELRLQSQNASAAYVSYGAIRNEITDTTAGSEDGGISLHTMSAGTQYQTYTFLNGVFTTAASVTSLAFSAGNPSLNIGTGALTAGTATLAGASYGVQFVTNQMNGAHYYDGDFTYWINYAGYNGGTTRYRTLNIGDGKNNQIASFSSTGLSLNGTMSISALPTSDPGVAGALWRDGTTVKVSV